MTAKEAEPAHSVTTEFGAAVTRWIKGTFSRDRRAACAVGDPTAATEVWRDLANLGVLGLRVPETAGGLAAPAFEMVAVAEALGKGGMTEAWGPVAAVATSILAAAGEKDSLAALATGEARPVLAWTEPNRGWQAEPKARLDDRNRLTGAKTAVAGGALAETYLVTAVNGDGVTMIAEIDAAASNRRGWRGWDGTDGAELTFDASPARVLLHGPAAENALSTAIDTALLTLAAEAVGAAQRTLDLTLDHLRKRTQFGRPLSTNQALRHRIAEAWTEIELAHAMVVRAARDFDKAEPSSRARAAAGAKHLAGSAARLMGEEGVQMHGGIGITEDADISGLYRRLVAIDLTLGGSTVALSRVRAASSACTKQVENRRSVA